MLARAPELAALALDEPLLGEAMATVSGNELVAKEAVDQIRLGL